MRLEGQRASENVEDRRGTRMGPVIAGGGLGALILAVVMMFMGRDPQPFLEQAKGPRGGGVAGQERELTAAEKAQGEWVKRVLGATEDVWSDLFKKAFNAEYQPPKLVMYTGQTRSGCGAAQAAVGPFYCPADQTVYIDLSFYDELHRKFGAPGDFAQAYVLAHEIGHHVQHLLGITDKVHKLQGRVSKEEYNDQSVRLELQADFFAGVWAHHAQKTKGLLEAGDIEEGLKAATAIGDDRLQMQSQGYVVPESFTHGTSEQRVRWFRKGLASGDLKEGDTFSVRKL
jgi:uncharacterized protein